MPRGLRIATIRATVVNVTLAWRALETHSCLSSSSHSCPQPSFEQTRKRAGTASGCGSATGRATSLPPLRPSRFRARCGSSKRDHIRSKPFNFRNCKGSSSKDSLALCVCVVVFALHAVVSHLCHPVRRTCTYDIAGDAAGSGGHRSNIKWVGTIRQSSSRQN